MKAKELTNRAFALGLTLVVVLGTTGLQVALANGQVSFSRHVIGTDMNEMVSVHATDLDKDGDVDVLGVSTNNDTMAWYENDGNSPPSFTKHVVTASADLAHSVYTADIDDDGNKDILLASGLDHTIAWYESDGSSPPSFTPHTISTSALDAKSVYAEDLDNDGDIDVLSASRNDNKIAWYENDGGSPPSFTAHTITTSANGANMVRTADLDDDGDADVLSASRFDDKIAWYENNGGSPPTFTTHIITLSADDTFSVDSEDVDGDGDIDVLSASELDHTVAWYENNGGSPPTFTTHIISTEANHAIEVYAEDIDGDNDIDVFCGSHTIGLIWYENDGALPPTFTPNAIGDPGTIRTLHSADIDDDGDMDLVSQFGTTVSWWENSGQFTNLAASTENPQVYPGDSVDVDLRIENADDLYAAQAECGVDPAVLELHSAVFGGFFDPINRLIAANEISPTLGTWFGAISQQNPAGPLSGDGLFATITYEALAPGTTDIICDPLFSDRDGFTQTVSFTGASVTVLPYATISGTVTYQGRLSHEGITVDATGPVTSTDMTGSNGDFVLDQLRAGTYTITADVGSYLPACTPVTLVAGDQVTLPSTQLLGGDLNDDDTINIGDATLLTANFNETVPPADARADINADSIINVQDLAILAGNYEISGCQSW